MNINYNTDLQVAQDLQKLSDTITRAVDYANLTLEEAKKVPELKQMISEAHVAKTSIENASSTLININASIENASSTLININASIENANNTFIKINTIVDSKSTDLKEIEFYVKEIKDLISKFNSLKTQNDRAETLLNQITPAYSFLQESSNNINESIENANNTLININATVHSKSNDLKEIEYHLKERKDLVSKFNNLKTQNDRAETLLKQIAPAYSSVQELSNELAGVYTLEKYLQKFKKNHKIKQLFRVLWKDFGVAGIFIYILICTIPKNSTMKSLFR